MALINSMLALLRGNVKCALAKLFHTAAFHYHPYLRMYRSARIALRNKGHITLGRNVKIDPQALLAANGGNLTLGDHVGVGKDNIIISQEQISIGAGTILGPNVLIYDHDHRFDPTSGVSVSEYTCTPVVIGKNCWIGANTVILKGTVIGNNCLVGAGSVIKGTFPDGSKIIQKRTTEVRREVQP